MSSCSVFSNLVHLAFIAFSLEKIRGEWLTEKQIIYYIIRMFITNHYPVPTQSSGRLLTIYNRAAKECGPRTEAYILLF